VSTHVLDVSGQRALTTTINDPARTAAQVNAKQGDDVRFQVGAAREVRIGFPAGAKVERRRYVSRSIKHDEKNRPVKDDQGEYVYEEKPYDSFYLVCQGVTVFARSSSITDAAQADADEGKPTYEPTPHTTMFVKRLGAELDFSESGELLEEWTVENLVAHQSLTAG
jgi:hypothetical protein